MTPPTATRRSLLRGTAGLVAVAGLGAAGSACARTPDGPDELEAPLSAARADAALAAAAASAHPDAAARLEPVAAARRAHADALAAEIRRARPDREEALGAPLPAPAAPATAAAAVSALRESLGLARDAALALALGAPRYRSGLAASVAASCAGFAVVLT